MARQRTLTIWTRGEQATLEKRPGWKRETALIVPKGQEGALLPGRGNFNVFFLGDDTVIVSEVKEKPPLTPRQAAMNYLLHGKALGFGRGPWVPAGELVRAVRNVTGCTTQAATGALRSLRAAGLADDCVAPPGGSRWWKPTDAATTACDLLREPV